MKILCTNCKREFQAEESSTFDPISGEFLNPKHELCSDCSKVTEI